MILTYQSVAGFSQFKQSVLGIWYEVMVMGNTITHNRKRSFVWDWILQNILLLKVVNFLTTKLSCNNFLLFC